MYSRVLLLSYHLCEMLSQRCTFYLSFVYTKAVQRQKTRQYQATLSPNTCRCTTALFFQAIQLVANADKRLNCTVEMRTGVGRRNLNANTGKAFGHNRIKEADYIDALG